MLSSDESRGILDFHLMAVPSTLYKTSGESPMPLLSHGGDVDAGLSIVVAVIFDSGVLVLFAC